MKNKKTRIVLFAFVLSIFAISLGYTVYLEILSMAPPRGEHDLDRIPWTLNCIDVEAADTYQGPSWHNITIGKTYWPGVMWQFGTIGFWNRLGGNVRFQFNTDWTEVCFHNGKVVALRTDSGSVSNSIPDWITIYGPPEIVTWSDTYGLRSIIWPERGVMVISEFLAPGSAEIENTGTFALYLFPPIAVAEFESSWLERALPDGPPDLPDEWVTGDSIDRNPLVEEMLLEDPWGIALNTDR